MNQFRLRPQFDLPANFEFNPFFRFVENVPRVGAPSYFEGNLQLAYKHSKELRVSFNVNNALREQHLEYSVRDFPPPPEAKIERAMFLNVSYQF